jgi:hypothetical protein
MHLRCSPSQRSATVAVCAFTSLAGRETLGHVMEKWAEIINLRASLGTPFFQRISRENELISLEKMN